MQDLALAIRQYAEEAAEPFSRRELTAAAARLSRDYQERSCRRDGDPFIHTSLDAAAYGVMRMPATLGACGAAMAWVRDLLPEDAMPATLLDVGAGTGAGTLAACSLFPLRTACCLETNPCMRTYGEMMTRRAAGEQLVDTEITWETWDLLSEKALPAGADLVVASYVLNELGEADALQAARRLYEASGRVLLLVETGTPAGFRLLRGIREAMTARGAHVLAPCPHDRTCPMAGDDWCHFAVRVARGRLAKALKGGDAPFEDEKFAFLALTKERYPAPSARVLRHPLTAPGQITLKLCTRAGTSEERTVRKREGDAFRQARKLRWGDLWELPDRESGGKGEP